MVWLSQVPLNLNFHTFALGDTDSGCPDHNYVFLKWHIDVNHSGVGNAMIPEQKVK